MNDINSAVLALINEAQPEVRRGDALLTSEQRIAGIHRALGDAVFRFAQSLAEVTDEAVPAVISTLKQLDTVVSEARAHMRERALLFLNVHGKEVTEKGTTEAHVSGYRMRAIPMRTGVDPKKLEAALRAKKLNPSDWMTPTITYKLNDAKFSKLVAEGHLTENDVKAVMYDKSYRLEVEEESHNG